VPAPGRGPRRKGLALDLQERRQGERVRRLGPRVEVALARPGTAGERGEGRLVGGTEIGDGYRLNQANLVLDSPHLPCEKADETVERLRIEQSQQVR
jgi:hypothetical protein